ncbi:MAG TPA: hypothetical protein DD396_04955 [Bacteroidetes bacterium]|jgi:cell wall-associated NlpC family hydrolase|nr:hypothetical protein [Bacteroidota bacterium]|tara:strand:- start:9627 stop:10148 length:522 start_codon:yes stop_codon:yes gene_type:complete
MRFTLLILFWSIVGSAIGQTDSLANIKSTHLDSTGIKKICTKLQIPNNLEANNDLLHFIVDWIGTPYCYGGETKKCTDCSGFTTNLYLTIYKKYIPRSSREIFNNCLPISKHALYEGDLVFFATSGGSTISHVGVYLWDDFFVHSSTSQGVIISNLKQGYYRKTYVSGGAWLD